MNPLSAFFALAARQADIRRAFALWGQVKPQMTELIDIVRDIGDDVGLLEQKPQPVSQVPEPLRQYTTDWVQSSLNTLLGTNLAADGVYGPATTAAVAEFQKKHPSLQVDGRAGVQTVSVMVQELERLDGP